MHKVFSILLNAIKLWLLVAKCPAPTILQWNGTTLASQQRENGRGTLSSFQIKLVWRLVSQLSISNSQFNFIGRVVQGMTIGFDLRDNWVPGDMFTPGHWQGNHTEAPAPCFSSIFSVHPIVVSDPILVFLPHLFSYWHSLPKITGHQRGRQRTPRLTAMFENFDIWGIFCVHEVVWRWVN